MPYSAAYTDITIEAMVTNLVGDWTPDSYPMLFRNGFNFVADLIPATSELWASGGAGDSPNAGLKQTNYDSGSGGRAFNLYSSGADAKTQTSKIIRIIRTDDTGGTIDRECREISYAEYAKGRFAYSIKYHARSILDPVWSWKPNGRVLVSPALDVGTNPIITIYWWPYLNTDYWDSNQLDFLENSFGFPQGAIYAAVLRCSLNILQTKLSTAVHDDEDAELVQLLQAQMVSLNKAFQEELQRLNVPYKKEGVEDK